MASPMNPSSSRPGPSSQQLHICEGDGCPNPIDTWPLHHVYRCGEHSSLCISCILLSHRSYYCCSCFFLIPGPYLWSSSSSQIDESDQFMALLAPITRCSVCHDAVAHLACLPHSNDATFVCPACAAAAEGIPFSYVPPCRTPLGEFGARVLVIATRVALEQLRRIADVALAEAEHLALIAVAAGRSSRRAVAAVADEDTKVPSRNINVQLVAAAPPPPPPSPSSTNRHGLERGEGSGMASAMNAPAPPPPRVRQQLHRAMDKKTEEVPSRNVNVEPKPMTAVLALPAPTRAMNGRHLERGEGSGMARSVNVPPPRVHQKQLRRAMGEEAEVPSQNVNVQPEPVVAVVALPPRSRNRRRLERGEGSGTASAVNAPLPPPRFQQQLSHAILMPPLSGLTIGGGDRLTRLAMAATAAARDSLSPRPPPRTLPLFGVIEEATAAVAEASPPTPPTLQLFPTRASSSSTSAPRTLQLFQDEIPDDEEM